MEGTTTKLLASMMAVGLTSVGLGYATFAFFSDTETSTANIFTTGDLDLLLNGVDSITGTLSTSNLAPTDVITDTIILSNAGSIFNGDSAGHCVDLDFKFTNTVTDDLGGTDPDDGGVSSAAPLDTWLDLTNVSYNGIDLVSEVTDLNGNGRKDLDDLVAHGTFADRADPLAATKPMVVTLTFNSAGPNHLKRDSVDLSITYFLAQCGEVDLA